MLNQKEKHLDDLISKFDFFKSHKVCLSSSGDWEKQQVAGEPMQSTSQLESVIHFLHGLISIKHDSLSSGSASYSDDAPLVLSGEDEVQ